MTLLIASGANGLRTLSLDTVERRVTGSEALCPGSARLKDEELDLIRSLGMSPCYWLMGK